MPNRLVVVKEPSWGAETHAGGRVLNAGPEVGGVVVPAEVLPQHEVVRPRRVVQLEPRHVHRFAVGRDRGTRTPRGRRRAGRRTTSSASGIRGRGLRRCRRLASAGGRENDAGEGDKPHGAHQRTISSHRVALSRTIDGCGHGAAHRGHLAFLPSAAHSAGGSRQFPSKIPRTGMCRSSRTRVERRRSSGTGIRKPGSTRHLVRSFVEMHPGNG